MTSAHFAWIMLDLTILAIAVYILHATLGRRWAHNEPARRALGIGTVLAALAPLAATGIIDIWTWGVTFAAFIVAGGVICTCWADEGARERERRDAELRAKINDAAG